MSIGDIMRIFIFPFILLFAFISTAQAKFLNLNEIGEASCRVRVAGSAGSGSAIAQDKSFIYVLTNAHVVGSSKKAACEFFRYGRKTGRIPGTVIWKSYSTRTVNDFALIRLNRSHFGKFPPRIVPLAPATHVVKQNDYIASAGCPSARWLQLWEGHALSEAASNRVLFTPPPLGGQSGSGVYTIINGNSYLCAVLTWKIDGSKGGAIHIGNFLRALRGEVTEPQFQTRVPSHWKYVKQETVATPTTKAYYAQGANGIYYLQIYQDGKWRQGLRLPQGHEGTEIVKWNIPLTVQCPNGRCPPFLNPNRPPITGPNPTVPPPVEGPPDNDNGNGEGNPYGGILPPNLGSGEWEDLDKVEEYKTTIQALSEEVDKLSKEKETLAAHIEVLTTEVQEKTVNIDTLTTEKEELATNIKNLSTTLDGKAKKLDQLEENIAFLESSSTISTDQILALNQDVNSQLAKIEELQDSLTTKSSIITDLVDQHEVLETQSVEVKQQRNLLGWLFGGTTGGVLLCLLSGYWKIRGKEKLFDIMDGKFSPQNEPITDPPKPQPIYRDWQPEPNCDPIPEPQCGTKQTSDNDLSGLADYLQDKFEGIIDDKVNSLNAKIDQIEISTTPTQEEEDTIPVLKSHTSKKPCTNKEQNSDCCETILDFVRQPSFPVVTDRIKDFVDLKKADGENVEELAFYAHLYKEAVDLLKNNKLIITKNAEPLKINSQVKAAEAIESYVKNQFLHRVSSATISRHILYHEAMIGFLYKHAIIRLRRGEFNVLGYKEVAGAIEQWVKAEFMRRMGFDF